MQHLEGRLSSLQRSLSDRFNADSFQELMSLPLFSDADSEPGDSIFPPGDGGKEPRKIQEKNIVTKK